MSVKVITPPASEPLTLAEVKENLRVVTTDEDASITRMLKAARQMAEERMRRALMPQVLEFASNGFPWPYNYGMTDPYGRPISPYGEIRLPRAPMVAVTSVKYIDGNGAQQTLDPAAYLVNEYVEPPTISAAFGFPWPVSRIQPASVVVRYSAGYADAASVPEPIKQWMLLAVGAMYENRELVSNTQTYELAADFACDLIQPYMVYE